MIDYTKIQMSSAASSNKVLLEGFGDITVAALGGAGQTTSSAAIPHGFNGDNLLFQVTTTSTITTGAILPWESNDGRVIQYARVDSTNLYVHVISSDTSGAGAPGFLLTYYYRVLVP